MRVRQREREIGIRMALGALPRMVAIDVIRQGLGYAALGMFIGMPAALALTRLMSSMVFGVTTRDPLTFSVLPVLLAVVTIAACYPAGPARGARRSGPRDEVRVTAERQSSSAQLALRRHSIYRDPH